MRLIEKFNVATISDIHYGNPRNDPKRTIAAMDEMLYDDGLLKRIKLLVIAGDVYDRLMDLSDPAVVDVDRWFLRLDSECAKHGVILVFLEGTPSHDRRQPARFMFLHEAVGKKSNFRYIDKVSIVYFPELGVNALFIPDEAYPTTTQTREVVEALLQERNLEKVDLAFMHGFFQYQIPYQTKETAFHDLDFYLSIVRFWIFIGHVHTHSRNGHAVAQGSFDRNAHGEEEPKGFAMASVADPKGDQMWFMENKHAHTYNTLTFYDMTMEDTFIKLEKELAGYSDFDRVRIEAESTHPIFEHFIEVQKRWPTLNFTKHPKKMGDIDNAGKMAQEAEVAKWEQISITKENITQLMIAKMTKMGVDLSMIERSISHLQAAL